MKKSNTKPKNVSYTRIPGKLWKKIKKHFPKNQTGGKGRPARPNRAVMDGIWYVLWSGCQWKSIEKEWFGVCSSVLHQRFQTWARQGVFVQVAEAMLRYYGRARHIRWTWQAADCRSVSAPYGGNGTGPNPTDRAKAGGKVHLLVDQRGAPLAMDVFGANQNEKWHIAALICSILMQPPTSAQHLCLDKAYDSWEVHIFVKQQGYVPHIKHRRRVNEPNDPCPIPGETQYPPRRWVVERTLGWLGHRRSIRTRYCRKGQNWLAFIYLACAHILFDFAFFG
jgi:transposase